MHEMQARGLEGLIAKKRDSKYESGRRSGAWAKFKWTLEQEFVIGGFTPPQGTRCCFGAILVGYYEGPKLIFAGKVGTGFTQKILESLYAKFKKLVRHVFVTPRSEIERLTMAACIFNPQHVEAVEIDHGC